MSDKKVSVKNRSSSMVVYSVPEMGIRREFAPNEVKTVSMDELNALSYLPGGMNLIRKHLFVQDESALQEMSVKVEPEYYLDEKGKTMPTANNAANVAIVTGHVNKAFAEKELYELGLFLKDNLR